MRTTHTPTRLILRLSARLAVFAFLVLLPVAEALAADPGLPLPNTTEINDQKTGSVLLFPLYLSNAATPESVNTRVALTNTSLNDTTSLHLIFVAGDSGAVLDSFVCLTATQTVVFLAGDVDPGTRGYLVALAVDQNGCPRNFNFLAGSAYVKLASGHTANLAAEAVAALALNPTTCNTNSDTATLNFDGTNYNLLPRTLALDKLRSPADGNAMLLVVNRLGGNLATGNPDSLGALSGELINDVGAAFPFTHSETAPQLFLTLSDTFPATAPVFSAVIPSGRTGWLTIFSNGNAGLFGALINFNAATATTATAFKSGHNLRKLTLATAVALTIPVTPPGC